MTFTIHRGTGGDGEGGIKSVVCGDACGSCVLDLRSLLITITAGDQLACRHVSVISG
jgi:hypothetical protein